MTRRARSDRAISTIVLLGIMLIARAAAAQEMSLRAVYNVLSGVTAPIWVGQEVSLFTR